MKMFDLRSLELEKKMEKIHSILPFLLKWKLHTAALSKQNGEDELKYCIWVTDLYFLKIIL